MAFIPDEALKKFPKLTPAARLLYGHLCMYRDRETGETWRSMTSLQTLQSELDLSRPAVFRAKKELLDFGWIRIERDAFIPIFGNFDLPSQSQKRDSQSQKLDSPVSKMILPSLKNETPESQKLDSDIYNDCAHVSSSPISSPIPAPMGESSVCDSYAGAHMRDTHTSTPQGDSQKSIPEPNPAVAEYCRFFQKKPTPYQAGQIAEKVTDLERWRTVLDYCAGNGWPEGKVWQVIQGYEKGIDNPRAPQEIQSRQAKAEAAQQQLRAVQGRASPTAENRTKAELEQERKFRLLGIKK